MSLANWLGMAVTSFAAALLLATNGFGFAVLAVPFFLLFAPPDQAVQVVIILNLAISLTVLPGIRSGIDAPQLARLSLGSLIGLPPGLVASTRADPLIVRAAAGATIAVFAAVLAWNRYRRRPPSLTLRPAGDIVAGVAAGAATALVGMPGPPVVIYLILAGAPAPTMRATQIAFFALIFSATLVADMVVRGVPGADWTLAAGLLPPTAIGGVIGLRIGNRLGDDAAALLATAVLGGTGLYTLAAAARLALW